MTNFTLPLRSVCALALAACFSAAQAEPTLPQVVSGQVTFAQQGNVFSITNSPSAIINWQTFSVKQGEITRFVQQSADSSVLNRVVGRDPSQILGALQSNGHVFLINPNGIVFGKDARVDVNGLTASTLALSNADFLAGANRFSGNGAAVVNQGSIRTPSGGKVYLIASSVENSGIINAPNGDVVLAAGHTVRLADSGNPDLHVVLSAPDNQAVNLGQLVADGGRVGIYGALVRQRGMVNADSARIDASGKVVLRASGDVILDAASVTSARAASRGGAVSVLGQRVAIDGAIDVSASGAAGQGGTVLAGGDYQGANPLVPNAQQLYFGRAAAIKADGAAGGKVILWSDGSTRAFGRISASGKDALVETSGHVLQMAGLKVASGGTWLIDPLDINVVTTATSVAAPLTDALFTSGPSAGTSEIEVATLESVAGSANILLQATNNITFSAPVTRPTGTTGTMLVEAGNNIDINAALTTNGGQLQLHANSPTYATTHGVATIGSQINTGGGRFEAQGYDVLVKSAGGITTSAGAIDIGTGRRFYVETGGTLSGAAAVNLFSDNITLDGTITNASGGNMLVTIAPANTGRAIDINANINTGALQLSPTALGHINAPTIAIGRPSQTGMITVNSGFSSGSAGVSRLTFESQDDIAFTAPVTLGAPGAAIVVTRSASSGAGGITLNDASPNTGALTADVIELQSDTMRIGGSLTTLASNGRVVLTPFTPGASINIGSPNDIAGTLGLSTGELGRISTRDLTIGDRNVQTGSVVLSDGWNLTSGSLSSAVLTINAGSGNLLLSQQLITPGKLKLQASQIDDTQTAPVKAGLLSLETVNGIGTSTPLYTETAYLHAVNTKVNGVAPINISNTGTLDLGNVRQDGAGNSGNIGIANAGGMTLAMEEGVPAQVSTSGGGGITLKTMSPLTINGSIANDSGPIVLEAGNGGVLTIGGGASVASAFGAVSLTGSSVVNNGSVATGGSGVTVVGTPSGTGSYSAANGVLTNTAPAATNPVPPTPPAPTIDQCVANPVAAGCGDVLPTLAVCVATPAAPGCSVVLPGLDSCIATPSAPGCGAVLPTLPACTAAPATPGCTVVLPTLATCTLTPTAGGCSVVLPSLNTCVATPSSAGCSVVLPTLAACTAAPSNAGCGAVLPSLMVCTAAPASAGCSVVLPTLAACTAAPSSAGCSVVLPTLDACTAAPTSAGCGAVLPTLALCTAAPSSAGCLAVLPSLPVCSATPSAPGCAAVLPSLAACTAAPALGRLQRRLADPGRLQRRPCQRWLQRGAAARIGLRGQPGRRWLRRCSAERGAVQRQSGAGRLQRCPADAVGLHNVPRHRRLRGSAANARAVHGQSFPARLQRRAAASLCLRRQSDDRGVRGGGATDQSEAGFAGAGQHQRDNQQCQSGQRSVGQERRRC